MFEPPTELPPPRLKNSFQERILGQNSAVSLVDPNDLEDIARLMTIENDPEVQAQMTNTPKTDEKGEVISTKNDLMSPVQLIDWGHSDKDHILMAVRGSEGVVNSGKPEEFGELQGWVQFRKDEPYRLNVLAKLGIINPEDAHIWEISYARHPQALNKQIASALRQAIILLPKFIEEVDPSQKYIYERDFIITAYVDPNANRESVRVLERAGFEKRGSLRYDPTETDINDVYILNLAKLYNRLHKDFLTTSV